MKLNIPSFLHTKPEIIDTDGNVYLTPNTSLSAQTDKSIEEFRTPLTEMPTQFLHTPPTGYEHRPSIQRNCCIPSSSSEENDDDIGVSTDDDDSGLDENFHTPRVAKIKSMENLSILEMEFNKASRKLDRNSPRRLKTSDTRLPKIKSLNNLVLIDSFEGEALKQEFEKLRHSKTSPAIAENVGDSPKSGKFIKNKVGNAKFIGNDDTPDGLKCRPHYPIAKMKSLGTIPDVVAERIGCEPFLTPTSGRKTFPSDRTFNDMGNSGVDVVDCSWGSSLKDFTTYERLGKLHYTPEALIMSRTPFERAYRRSYQRNGGALIQNVKSSTPLRQSDGYVYYAGTDASEGTGTASGRPNSNLMRNPSSGSLVISETGSLDRMKTAAEKRKKGALDDGAPRVSDRVEETRVNPNSLIDEILKDTKLDQFEESAETSGLKLYIAKDGTASLGSHEVKSRVSAGAFKQVVMETPR